MDNEIKKIVDELEAEEKEQRKQKEKSGRDIVLQN